MSWPSWRLTGLRLLPITRGNQVRIVVLSITFRSTISIGLLSAALMRRLAELPEVGGRHNVCHVASNARGERCVFDGYPVSPLGDNGLAWAEMDLKVVAQEVLAYRPDLVIVNFAANLLRGLVDLLAPVPVWWWLTVESDPISPLDLAAIEGATAISMSKFGLEQLERAGVEDRAYIPAGLDPAFVVSEDQAARQALRAQIAGPDCTHLTGIVARYYVSTDGDRKAYAQQLRAWAAFAEDKPGARLYCHVPREDKGRADGQSGVYDMVRALGLAGRVLFPKDIRAIQGISTADMARLYGAFDVLLSASASEGFGLPIIEAQACGTPVVTTNWTAMGELTHWGLAVDPLDMQWVPSLRSWWAWPDVQRTTMALQALYVTWQDAGGRWPMELRRTVSRYMCQEFGWDRLFREKWTPLVQGVANRDSVALSAVK